MPPQHLVIVASPEPIEDYAKVVNGPHTYAVGFHDTTTRRVAKAMDVELVRHLRLVRPG